VIANDKMVDLKEDRSHFVRVIMVCKSRPEIDTKEAVGQYEFSYSDMINVFLGWHHFSLFLNGHICLSFCKKEHDKGSTTVVRYEMM